MAVVGNVKLKDNWRKIERDPRYQKHYPSFAEILAVATIICICDLRWNSVSVAGSPTNIPISPSTIGLPSVARCNEACRYEVYFFRAHCDERSLQLVPISAGCEDVQLLELQGNSITTITAEQMSQYANVRTLDVSSNQIDSLDSGTFLNNHQLRNIMASNNKLRVLQGGTFNGTENTLVRIYLQYNDLERIEKTAFRGLKKVTKIYLNNNRLRYLPSNIFRDLKELTHLSLANNSLLEIAENCFRNLTKLQSLHLDVNNLTNIPAGMFDGLHDLKELNLSNNQLNIIPPPEMLGLRQLQMIDLTNNRFYQSGNLVPFLFNVTDLLLFGGNPFSCDCDFQTLQDWFHEASDSQKLSLSTESQVRCTTGNGIFVSIQSNLRLGCLETDGSTSPQVEMLPTSHPTKRKDTPNLNSGSVQKNCEIFNRQGKENDPIDDTNGGKLEFDYKAMWICYYTAIILTGYISIRFATWLHKKKYCRYEKKVTGTQTTA